MVSALLALAVLSADPAPIDLLPENPHYLRVGGKPAVLITSGEHYGAVLNLDFDFVPYLATLQGAGLNLTRTFSGTYREVPGAFKIEHNTLAPLPDRYLAPWVRVEGAKDGKPERFDLDRFEPAYFERLKAFLTEAGRQGVIVELVLFCPLYEENLWAVNPMNASNNTNGVGKCPRNEVYTLKHADLLERQLAFVRKVVAEVNGFDNLYFEICNEPYFGGVTLDWQRKVADAIVATEKDLPRKHLIAQNIANDKAKINDPNPAVSIFNFHYASPAAALDNFGLNRALGDDETGFEGTKDRPYRSEAWLFVLSGGSIVSNLDYSYTPDHEDGTAVVRDPTPGGGGPALRKQFGTLRRFVEGLEFWKMRPEPGLVRGPGGAAALVEPGRQYAVYFAERPGKAFTLDLPAGDYRLEWLDPAAARPVGESEFHHDGGAREFTPPETAEDIALKVVRKG